MYFSTCENEIRQASAHNTPNLHLSFVWYDIESCTVSLLTRSQVKKNNKKKKSSNTPNLTKKKMSMNLIVVRILVSVGWFEDFCNRNYNCHLLVISVSRFIQNSANRVLCIKIPGDQQLQECSIRKGCVWVLCLKKIL